jgi:ureidoacrylate peracid hydrolase
MTEKPSPKSTALIIIDMQNDFISEKGYFHSIGRSVEPLRKIIPNIRKLVGFAREMGIRRVWTATNYMADGSDDMKKIHKILGATFVSPNTGKPREITPLEKGSWGAEIIDELKPPQNEKIIFKRRPNAFFQTDLELTLRSWAIQTLIITGITTEVCVESTARSAFMRDFDIIVVSDATATWDDRLYQGSLNNVRFLLGWVATCSETINLFKEK